MIMFATLALWTAFITGWGNVFYYYTCGIHGVKPNYEYTVKSLIAAIVSLALGSICQVLLQSTLQSYKLLTH